MQGERREPGDELGAVGDGEPAAHRENLSTVQALP